jgi:2-methylcitrate dehydratase
VTVNTYWVADRYQDRSKPDWRPSTRETADHSIPYIVAAVLLDGRMSAETFSDERIRDPRLQALLDKMKVVELPEYTAMYPDGCPCRIDIVAKGGVRKSASVQYFKGHAKNPLSDAEIETKFRALAADLIDSKEVDFILDSLWNCEKVADICDVLKRFVVRGQLGKQV